MAPPTSKRRDAAARHIKQLYDESAAAHSWGTWSNAALDVQLDVLTGHWKKFEDEHLGLADNCVDEDAQVVQDDLMATVRQYYVHARGCMVEIIESRRTEAAMVTSQSTINHEADETLISIRDEVQVANQATHNQRVNEQPTVATIHHAPEIPPTRNVSGITNTIADIRLEKVTIQKFDGNHLAWLAFRDQFVALVHSKATIDDATKFWHLKSHLGPEPLKVLAGLPQTANCYAEAWELLLERYDRQRELVDLYLKRFFELPVMKNENAAQLLQLIDGTNEVTRSLPSLDVPVNQWDAILIFCLNTKLDTATKRAWANETRAIVSPRLQQLISFLSSRARSIDTTPAVMGSGAGQVSAPSRHRSGRVAVHAATAGNCRMCQGAHPLYRCVKFKELTPRARIGKAQNWKLCFKCLTKHDLGDECKLGACPVCGKAHNRLLCYGPEAPAETPTAAVNTAFVQELPLIRFEPINDESGAQIVELNAPTAVVNSTTQQRNWQNGTPMLGTVQVRIINSTLSHLPLRALCDSGSQISLISERSVQRLGLQRQRVTISLTGIGGVDAGSSAGIVRVKIAPCHSDPANAIEATLYILRRLTSTIPSKHVNIAQWPHIQQMVLADSTCGIPGTIDILLGVDIWGQIIQRGMYTSRDGSPTAQQTKFGWVLFGTAVQPANRNIVQFVAAATTTAPIDNLEQLIHRFWESEETEIVHYRTPEEQQCEQVFVEGHYRDGTGRYVVKLPFNDKIHQLGSSRQNAFRQFKRLEQGLACDERKRSHYLQFMYEYEQLGHMTQQPNLRFDDVGNFIPHHAVAVENKFRVVFNGSNPTSTGVSLNDAQMVGEKLQEDLAVIIMRFRAFKIAITADIVKMYRQVLVEPEQRRYQRILWRTHPTEEIREYELNTVTYGEAAAPHCAIRALRQCAQDHHEEFPVGAEVVLSSFYVDDMIGGGDTIEEVEQIRHETTALLAKGGFELRKFCSNNWQILSGLNEPIVDPELSLNLAEHEETSVLGLKWLPQVDRFIFKITPIDLAAKCTKRIVVGQIGRLYDPNGYLAPTIVVAKIIIQKLWRSKVDWDETIPDEIFNEWARFVQTLPSVENLRIPRWLGMAKTRRTQLHGFSDASINAFAAVIYTRTIDEEGNITIGLVTAKTKVAPLKQMSVPRLELCGAQLLVRLMKTVERAYAERIERVCFWSDSEIVLHWIHKPSAELRTYAANRVQEIQDGSTGMGHTWRYVPTATNPADIASRGAMPDELLNAKLWWHGPDWLSQSDEHWPPQRLQFNIDDHEARTAAAVEEKLQVNIVTRPLEVIRGPWFKWAASTECELLLAYSSIDRLEIVVAVVLRFINNSRAKQEQRARVIGRITPTERAAAQTATFKLDQHKSFRTDIQCCRDACPLPSQSKLLALNPFLDGHGVLRLGSRAENAQSPFDTKFPILLAHDGIIATLITQREHHNTMHGGAQQILQTTRQQFWVLNGRNLARRIINECIVCFRHRMKTGQQLMGSLPRQRVTQVRPFARCGVDYCGPVTIKARPGRCRDTTKGYVAVFVCMVTRAVHLELVSDLTSAAFLAALRTFMARRGRVDSPAVELINMRWRFITPAAPHMGGIWEAAVKSAKKHLIKVIGEQWLTFEEYATILTQVEACLNSRPLTPMSDDPNDLAVLAPAHFLIGAPLVAAPEEPLDDVPANRLTRWHLLQQIQQHIWQRWQKESINTLVNRPKWQTPHRNYQVGDLVVIREDNTPPTRWKLGRITEVYPGPDGYVRSVEIKHSDGVLRRPISKLGLLPTKDE